MGLAIAKQLAVLMGGEMGVHSKPGKGSTFWFTAELEKQVGNARDVDSCDINLIGGRILIVDDNATHGRILRHQLETCQILVETASNGPEALDLLRAAVGAGALTK